MRRTVVIGAETHIEEITSLVGAELQVVGVLRPGEDETEGVLAFNAPVFPDMPTLFAEARPDLAVISNANDLKAAAVVAAIEAGCDVVVDKPLAIAWSEQRRIEQVLRENPSKRLLMLLTLRGSPLWAGMRDIVRSGQIGDAAFCHVRMAVRLKREARPPWFLDWRRSGGVFLDLLIHGLDQVEWVTGLRIVAVTATTGHLGDASDVHLRDHAAVYCELENGGSAVVEGQRMLPDTKGSDYRMLVAGTKGYADLVMSDKLLRVTTPSGAESPVAALPPLRSVVADWLERGDLVGQDASLRANRLAMAATSAAAEQRKMMVDRG